MKGEEVHPYNTLQEVPAETCLLIVGTAPPQRFAQDPPKPLCDGDIDFYYGSADNQLWSKIFPAIYKTTFVASSPDVSRRIIITFLKDHKIWMRDILLRYSRNDDSANDKDLIPLDFTTFRPIFELHPTIKTLIFTGELAEKLTGAQLTRERLIRDGQFRRVGNMPRPRQLAIDLDGEQRGIITYTLPSPSKATFQNYVLDKKIKMYADIFLDRCPSNFPK
jgi:G:T/U-mismatch repair DNA glycosylase